MKSSHWATRGLGSPVLLGILLAGCGSSGTSVLDAATPAPDAGTPGQDATSTPEDARPTHDGGDRPDADGARDLGIDTGVTPDSGPTGSTFTISGRVSFDFIPAVETPPNADVSLNYAGTQARPARRVVVVARQGGAAVAETRTDDDGRFSLSIASGKSVSLRIEARMQADTMRPDGIEPDGCSGGNLDVQVVDNTQRRALYALAPAATYSAETVDLRIHAATTHGAGGYTDRAGAPFQLLDTVLRELELVCSVVPSTRFPPLFLNWSVNNSTADGTVENGGLGTSYFEIVDGAANVFIVGLEDDDTDEYDAHVIAHEVGHYLESALYRSDSPGGSHTDEDVLDPSVALSEGWGNAVSGFVWDEPLYIDTSGAGQADGFSFSVDVPAEGNDRGLYSETSVQNFLWSLFAARPRAGHAGSMERIDTVLRQDLRTTPSLTTALVFAAHYNQRYGGAADGLQTLWRDGLDMPFDALCSGPCTGTGDVADPFDRDNDLGRYFADGGGGAREYPAASGRRFDADFWRLFRALRVGLNSSDGHTQTNLGDYTDYDNKWGAVRYFVFEPGTAGRYRVRIDQLRGGPSCRDDVIDLYAAERGVEVASDDSTSGCPDLVVPVSAGVPSILSVFGLEEPVDAWATTISGPKRKIPAKVQFNARPLAPGRVEVSASAVSTLPGATVGLRLRGLDGVEILAAKGPRVGRGGVERAVTLAVPRDHQGRIVADVEVRRGSLRRFGTKSFVVGEPHLPPLRRTLGRLVDEPEGDRVLLAVSPLPAASVRE